jgi:hypothetical protein
MNMHDYNKIMGMIHKLLKKYCCYVGEVFKNNKDLESFASALLRLEDTIFGFPIGFDGNSGHHSSSSSDSRATKAELPKAYEDISMDLDNASIK